MSVLERLGEEHLWIHLRFGYTLEKNHIVDLCVRISLNWPLQSIFAVSMWCLSPCCNFLWELNGDIYSKRFSLNGLKKERFFCVGATILTRWEIHCLPCAVFFISLWWEKKKTIVANNVSNISVQNGKKNTIYSGFLNVWSTTEFCLHHQQIKKGIHITLKSVFVCPCKHLLF